MTDLTTDGYKMLRAEFNLMWDGDAWGDSLGWHFAIAETLHHNGYDVPPEWKFRDSPVHGDDWVPDDYTTQTCADMLATGEITDDDLTAFGNVLARYLRLLESAGRSY